MGPNRVTGGPQQGHRWASTGSQVGLNRVTQVGLNRVTGGPQHLNRVTQVGLNRVTQVGLNRVTLVGLNRVLHKCTAMRLTSQSFVCLQRLIFYLSILGLFDHFLELSKSLSMWFSEIQYVQCFLLLQLRT